MCISAADNSKKRLMAVPYGPAIILLCLIALLSAVNDSFAQTSITAYDLINLVNGQRSSNGLGTLTVDANIMACAQATAETMAASHMTWHIGNASGRISAYGYNNYNACFATENFMMGNSETTISQIAATWSDSTHQIASTSSSYCAIGAGVASTSDGYVYFVIQAAYPAGSKGCSYSSGTGSAASSSSTSTGAAVEVSSVSQIVMSVVTSTPDESGYLYHEVQEGQTLWTISEAYGVTIEELQAWNNLNNSTALSLGEKLLIPATGAATPTPQVELTVLPTADASGKFYYEVREGDTLSKIADLWHVSLSNIYLQNGLDENSTIGLGWKILIPVTATVTPMPTDTPTPTLVPTETFTPTVTLEAVETPEPTQNENASEDDTLMHLPKASSRTYIILGMFVLILVGAGLIVYGVHSGKKNDK